MARDKAREFFTRGEPSGRAVQVIFVDKPMILFENCGMIDKPIENISTAPL